MMVFFWTIKQSRQNTGQHQNQKGSRIKANLAITYIMWVPLYQRIWVLSNAVLQIYLFEFCSFKKLSKVAWLLEYEMDSTAAFLNPNYSATRFFQRPLIFGTLDIKKTDPCTFLSIPLPLQQKRFEDFLGHMFQKNICWPSLCQLSRETFSFVIFFDPTDHVRPV